MNNSKELLKQLRDIRLQIPFIEDEDDKRKLIEQANALHKAYGRSLFEEKGLEKGRGR